ncbi:hypothetical protein H2509_01030 [Stappia sp. F7233]|uniref:Uncharacterized protein n=1 Tax=Stappia albiluteola TaxID=2758565 RepID=A0A839A854_9HYPH|nr:hypothetical protein [Stappia albiluteola]MBA5775703.1 hypothetical protein [Stappia albiluteola]
MKTVALATGIAMHHALLLAAYLASGPLRTHYLDPVAGPLPGAMGEAALFVAVSMASVALVLPRLSPDWTVVHAVTVGSGALLLFAISDAAIATVFCGVPLTGHFARFGTQPGLIQAGALAFHVAAPALWLVDEGKNAGQKGQRPAATNFE